MTRKEMIEALIAYDTSSFFDNVEDAVKQFSAVMRGDSPTYARMTDEELLLDIKCIGLEES